MSIIESFKEAPRLLKIQGVVQHYPWGGARFIPELLNVENPDEKPFAEYWLGAHPKAPSIATRSIGTAPLDELITAATEQALGQDIVNKFGGRLPYLFKVLDARDMLSIQVHPNLEQAKAGFARENKEGVPLDAPYRNYKDDNHKPEVHVALTDFWMLHGFRDVEEIDKVLKTVPEFKELLPHFKDKDIRSLYSHIMQLPQEQVNAILNPLINRLAPEYHNRKLAKENPDYWASKAAINFPLDGGNRDRGIFSIYLFNLVHLKPGEGTFQAAGVPHAYLEGVNMELMASSDNVLRGGLTPKHVDVPELLNTLDFTGGHPDILCGNDISRIQTVYQTPVDDFELSRINIDREHRYESGETHGPDIFIVLQGKAEICGRTTVFTCYQGEAFFAPTNVPFSFKTQETCLLYRATVPV